MNLYNSVARLSCLGTRTNVFRPYETGATELCSGSAFVFDSDADFLFLATAYHVVAEKEHIYATFPSSKGRVSCSLRGFNCWLDVAILSVCRKGFDNDSISVLEIEHSDSIHIFDAVVVAGYPNGSDSLKVTKGIVSGIDKAHMQVDAPIGAGNSGGPLLLETQKKWTVIGIIVACEETQERTGYVRPSSQFISHLHTMKKGVCTHVPCLNIKWTRTSPALRQYSGFDTTKEQGVCVTHVHPGSELDGVGIKSGDILLSLNNCFVNGSGQIVVPWWPEPVHLKNFLYRHQVGDLLTVEWFSPTKGMQKCAVKMERKMFPQQKKFPQSKNIDYEAFGGVVVCELCRNHIVENDEFAKRFAFLGSDIQLRTQSILVVTFVCPESCVNEHSTTISLGDVITNINGNKVSTLQEYREKVSETFRENFLAWTTRDGMVTCVAVKHAKEEWEALSQKYHFETKIFS